MKKILLVDDKVTIGRVLKIYLGTEYDLEYFEDPIKALEWLNEGNLPDLIISDIMMPGTDGFEFARTVREQNTELPILFMTARDDLTAKQRGFSAGADDYMVKPVDLD